MAIRKLSSKLLAERPYEAWNAFVNLIATEPYDDLDEIQRVAHLCFWYDSEVQNGGHLQYFENRGAVLLAETLAALRLLGADCQRAVLEAASRLFLESDRGPIKTVEDYVVAARSEEFYPSDELYHTCEPTIQKLLENYFQHHRNHFIEIIHPERHPDSL